MPPSCKQATPAVVNISEWKMRAATQPDQSPRRIKVYASGFVIDPSGIIVTNKHVVDGALEIHAIFSNGDRVPARLLVAAAMLDLAVLKVDVDHPLPALKWGDSDSVAGRRSGADHRQSTGSRHVGVRRDRQRAQPQSARQRRSTATSRPMQRSTMAIPAGRWSIAMAMSSVSILRCTIPTRTAASSASAWRSRPTSPRSSSSSCSIPIIRSPDGSA